MFIPSEIPIHFRGFALQAELSVDSNQNQCWYKKVGIQQCGMRTRYCCQKPEPEPTEPDESFEWLWIVGKNFTCWLIIVLTHHFLGVAHLNLE